MAVVEFEVVADGVLQFAGAAMDAAAQLFFGETCEPRSTRLSHDAPVGVKCRWKRG